MSADLPSRHLERARRWVAHRLWDVASRVWVEQDDGESTQRVFWDMNCTFSGTEAEAYRIFDAMTDVGHAALGLHESDTRFVVGGMRRDEFADAEEGNPLAS